MSFIPRAARPARIPSVQLRLPSLWIIPAAALLATGAAGCGSKSVAQVGGQSITQQQLLDDVMNSQAGASELNKLVVTAAVEQEAKDKGVAPTDQQIQQAMASAQAQDPQLAASLAQNRAAFIDTFRLKLADDNLFKQGVNITPAAKNAWFQAHHALFDLPTRVSVILVFFDDLDRATKGKGLLDKGSAPSDVAASLGTPNMAINGRASAPLSEQEMTQMYGSYGTEMLKTIGQLFSPSIKQGYTSNPVKVMGNRYVVLQLAKVVPAKPATEAAVNDQVELFMAAEQYGKKKFNFTMPASATPSEYLQLVRTAEMTIIKEVMESMYSKNQIKVNNAEADKAIRSQWVQPPTGAASSGAPGVSPGPGMAPGAAPPEAGGPASDAGASQPAPTPVPPANPAPAGPPVPAGKG